MFNSKLETQIFYSISSLNNDSNYCIYELFAAAKGEKDLYEVRLISNANSTGSP